MSETYRNFENTFQSYHLDTCINYPPIFLFFTILNFIGYDINFYCRYNLFRRPISLLFLQIFNRLHSVLKFHVRTQMTKGLRL